MELVKNEKIQNEKKIKKNENMPKKCIGYNDNNINNILELDSTKNNSNNKFNINEIRNDMTNNKININENHLITDLNIINISFKDKKNNNIESLESSNNDDLVMNQNYNYNPKSFSNNSSINTYNNNIIYNNILSISQPDTNKYNSNDNYQYYSEQKVFNPGLLFDFSTKKSTRSSISHHEIGNEMEYPEKNININIDKNEGRSSLNNIINEYIDSNGNYNENDLEENNIKDNKMTMNSFDSPQKNSDIDNDDENDIGNYNYNDKYEENNNVNLSMNKTINSEKMNLNNEEINNLLKMNNINQNENENKINDESQISNNYISSKNKKEKINTNNLNNTNNSNKKIEKNKIIKNNDKKENKNIKNNFLKQKNIINDNKINKIENKEKQINKNKIFEKIPFQGNYIEYKEYEKYILDNSHDELLNTGDEEDIFGKFVDNIIDKSYHIYTNRQCSSCANLLTNGKSCVKCPKYHHIIKSGNNKKIKNKNKK